MSIEPLTWLRAQALPATALSTDTRTLEAGDIFVALPGLRGDAARYVDAAVQRGARAVLLHVDEPPAAAIGQSHAAVPVLAVPGLARRIGPLAAAFYGNPSAQLRTIGITGTNGKTSTCQWTAQLLSACGLPCASTGTLGYSFGGHHDTALSTLTTPDAVGMQRMARRARDAGAAALAFEASSIGLEQGRLDGMSIEVAVFTNLTRDHLDYHGSMEAYGAAKRRLFDWPGLRHAVINLDDNYGLELARALCARGAAVSGYTRDAARAAAVRGLAVVLASQDLQHGASGMSFTLEVQQGAASTRQAVEALLVGDFNAHNLLAALGAALACGASLGSLTQAARGLRAPAGRLQPVSLAQQGAADASLPLAIVDYAHTPDALSKAVQALRPLAQARDGQIWIVFGAGGDRDRGKRPVMAAAAAAADELVLTSDNPRSEDPESILDEVAAGLPAGRRFLRLADRAQAIQAALQQAAGADVVLIAGKGHEDYQEIAGRRLPFSDLAVARAALAQRQQRAQEQRT